MKTKLFHRNFSLLIAGQASSLFGNGILDFAMSMYVLEKTGSAAAYAGFLAASMVPHLWCLQYYYLPWEGSWLTREISGTLWQGWISLPVWECFWRLCL